tara:strand:- start:1593 stop:2489 length:897 start_codon:yes stop_codon:yes gene_type:complete
LKILLTGASGQLGSAILENVPKSVKIVTPNRNELNLSNKDQCRKWIEIEKPQFVINSGAFTSVDEAEKNHQNTFAINSEAPKAFSEALSITGGKLLQISTDYVFNGKRIQPYLTNTKRCPLGIYGQSKSKGEQYIEEILFPNQQGIILRTSWLVSSIGKNFVKTILKLHFEKDEISVVEDQIGSLTSAESLSKACWEIINNWESISMKKKILHWSSIGEISWFDIAREISIKGVELGLIKKAANIIPIKTSEFPTLAKRPEYSVLECSSTRKLLQLKPLDWKTELYNVLIKIKECNKS